MKVTLEHETAERRWDPLLRRKVGVIVWKRAWTAEVLYADGAFIVTRSAGSHQTFRGVPSAARLRKAHTADWDRDGGIQASMWGHDPKHPAVVRLGLPRDRYGRLCLGRIRISPKSARALRETMTACGVSWLGRERDPFSLARFFRAEKGKRAADRYVKKVEAGIAARAGKRLSCKPSRSPHPRRKA